MSGRIWRNPELSPAEPDTWTWPDAYGDDDGMDANPSGNPAAGGPGLARQLPAETPMENFDNANG